MTALSSPATAARRLLAALALTASLLMTVGGPAHAPAAPTARATAPLATVPADETPVLTAAAVESIAIVVADLDHATAFYRDTLGFEPLARDTRQGPEFERLCGRRDARAAVQRLRLGAQSVELVRFLAPAGRPARPDAAANDLDFQHIAIVVADIDRAAAALRAAGARFISDGPQRLPAWNRAAAGISACYFRDPEGHALEIIHYPPALSPHWAAVSAANPDRLFLGIDHTAIAVADTDRALRFYRDALGMGVAGRGENYGPEQERLSGVFGAQVRITTLRAPSGPGVELLEYLAPATGRPAPGDTSPADAWAWQIRIRVAESPALAAAALRTARAPRLSAGPSGPDDVPPHLLVRDPDGHLVLIDSAPKSPTASNTP
ncbi:MAG: VOC family protein [Phycisphaerae bacterium]|nr:VOC family protein [Phycisphaerae bacterium]